jgi:hypothetical protein
MRIGWAVAMAGITAAPVHAQMTPSPSARFQKTLRNLWRPGEARFLRHWLVLAPVAGTLAKGPALPARGTPAAGLAQTLSDGRRLTWMPESSWTDLVDVASLLDTPMYRGRQASPEVAYAYTTIHRHRATQAILSVASDDPIRVWLNGRLVDSVDAPRTFLFDQDRKPVLLQAGDNRLLMEFQHRSGPWRFAVRVLRPGQPIAPYQPITPGLVEGPHGSLSIRTDITPDNPGAPVQVAAVAPGGRVLARADARRGGAIRFETASWPDGPYDIRLTTKTQWDKDAVVDLSWYKGDARVAARQLLGAARAAPVGPAGAQLRMLADLVHYRLGSDPMSAPRDAWPLVHSALMEYEELEQRAAGKPGPVRPYGFVRLAYTGEVDGSTQFCRAYLPPHYDPERRWPMVVWLHGFNPANPPYVGWWDVDKRHSSIAERFDVIVLEPHGRGNAQYLGIGEQDVLQCIAQAKRRFRVDPDRVYLMGQSMGGAGTWLIASHHPQLFAAAAPEFGGFDWRLVPGYGFENPHAASLPERFTARSQSSFAGAESLLDLPMLVTHGNADQTVPVTFSRFAVTMLQRWRYPIRYEEIPGRDHEALNMRDRIVAWLLEHRRVHAPHQVRIRAFQLDDASAYWASIMAFKKPLRPMEVDATAIRPGLIRLDTRNVAAIRLDPPEALRGPSAALHIVWNGRSVLAVPDASGSVLLQAPGEKLLPTDKRPGLQGGLSSFITTPFAIVVGTSSPDPRMRRLCREKADAFAAQWMAWQHVKPRVFLDYQLTRAEERAYSLLLVGGPNANRVTRRLIRSLPLRAGRRSFTIEGRRFLAPDAALQMIYPSPANPARYVLVVAATSTDGMDFWDPTGLWQMPLGYPTQPLDWTIRDGRLVTLEHGQGTFRTAVASGVFDEHWRLRSSEVFPGDAALREASPLRRLPSHWLTPSNDLAASLAGLYELYPGALFTITAKGSTLTVDTPGGGAYPLREESHDVFVDGESDTVAIPIRDSHGGISGLTINNKGGVWQAKKLQ